jgi:hypothetical protein
MWNEVKELVVFEKVKQYIVTDIRKFVTSKCDVRPETHSTLQQGTELSMASELLQ